MKRIIRFLAVMCLLVGCRNGTADEKLISDQPQEEPEDSAEVIYVEENPYAFLPEYENVRYILDESTALHMSGGISDVPYKATDHCIVYDQIILEGKSSQHLPLFENMGVKINSEYGICILQKMDNLFMFSFNPAAQFCGINAVVFDRDGNILKEFEDVDIQMNTLDETKFIVAYSCGKRDKSCEYPMSEYESDNYDIDGEQIIMTPDHYEDLEDLRNKAEENNALVSMALISTADDTVSSAYEGSVYYDLYHFMQSIDEHHTVNDGGDMLFCAVPTDPGASVSVNECSNPSGPEVLYRSDAGDPLFLITSVYDSSLQVNITDSAGRTVTIDLKDYGSDPAFINGDIYDFTYGGESDDRKQDFYDVLFAEYPDLKQYAADPENFTEQMELDDMVCYIAYFGTVQPNGHFTRERTFAVTEDLNRIYEYDTAADVWYYTVY